MIRAKYNKYRAAAEMLNRRRESIVDTLADEVLDQSEGSLESDYALQELLENQGTRLHFLGLLVAHLEQSADVLDEQRAAAAAANAPKRRKARKPRTPRKELNEQQATPESRPDES